MWQPDPSWRPLRGVGGPGSAGLWLAEEEGRRWVVKRLSAPDERTRALLDPSYVGWWRREAEVALHPNVVNGPGVVPVEYGAVEEDDDGITVWSREETGEPPPGPFVARALARFAAASHESPSWASRNVLADRLAMAEQRGGWPTLARTTLADVADRLWGRRHHWLARCAEGPHGRLHGDAVPSNFLTRRGEDVVAVDWQCFGIGPLGADLGYFALASREDFDVLLKCFLDGLGPGSFDEAAVTDAARVTAVYTVLSRTEWALAQAARGEGALAGKFRHPAVAPHVRALQRQFPQIEHLLAGDR
jgi:aminoglycoside phosphotransferase (APT) family kinase protein